MSEWQFFRLNLDKYPVEKEFIINKHLTLKLINSHTVIFVNHEPFHQCKYLLLNLTQKDFKKFDSIESIDEAFSFYNKTDKLHEIQAQLIDPETEFIGHCSNLQAWYEYDYDLRILHSSLSIPLLRKLAQVGDKRAIVRLKESIAIRITSKNTNTIVFYLNEEYFKLFTKEELETMFEDWLVRDVQFSFMDKRRTWYPLLEELINRGVEKARNILREDIVSSIKKHDFDTYQFLLNQNYFELINLEDLEQLYDMIPVRYKTILRRVQSLIISKAVKKRTYQN